MTSRMHAPHTTCPGCQEEVFLDELVGGKCPLCGCSLEDFEESIGEYDGILDRSDLSWLIFNYFVFKKFVDLGVPPSQIMEFVSSYEQNADKPAEEWTKTEFSLELPMGTFDRIRPSDARSATVSLCGADENRSPVTCVTLRWISSTFATGADIHPRQRFYWGALQSKPQNITLMLMAAFSTPYLSSGMTSLPVR